MIGLTKRSHVAPKMQHVTFCDSIVRFDWCRTKRIDSVCGVTWIPICARDGSVGETLSIHVVSTQCASGLKKVHVNARGDFKNNDCFSFGLLYTSISEGLKYNNGIFLLSKFAYL